MRPGFLLRAGRSVGIVVKLFSVGLILTAAVAAQASDLDTIGVTLLRQVDPTLNGSGVRVAQAEGEDPFTPNSPFPWEVNPASVGQPTSRFTWASVSNAAATTFPNSAGTESFHADSVGGNFYGNTGFGVATNVFHVDNYEAGYFFNNKINPGTGIPAVIVNQSFLFSASDQTTVDPAYDNYAASRKTLFVNGAGNGGSISSNPPATSYNCIAVGDYAGSSSFGPTADGRSKPDITAPPSNSVTSFATPYVSGSAAILWQAGANTSATNNISIKALLLNGAIKPADWTNGPVTPLDARYGAGIVNVFNSWKQLKGGLHASNETTTVTSGNSHPPGASTGNQTSIVGWDYNATLSTPTANQDKIFHYYFNLTNGSPYTFTATLVWNRQSGLSTINNLDLFLYDTSNGSLILSSTSAVDNVEHLFVPQLASGRYDLQVLKHRIGQVSNSETYALSFEFFCMKLKIALTNGLATLSWTNAPTGFCLVSTSALNPPASWSPVNVPITMSNGQNFATVPVLGTNQYFRLQRP